MAHIETLERLRQQGNAQTARDESHLGELVGDLVGEPRGKSMLAARCS